MTGTVLLTDRFHAGLRPGSFFTDVQCFEASLRQAERAEAVSETRAAHLHAAVDIYGGPILPASDENWVVGERERLQEHFIDALQHLANFYAGRGHDTIALNFSRRAVLADSLQERTHQHLIRLLESRGRIHEARAQRARMERALEKDTGIFS